MSDAPTGMGAITGLPPDAPQSLGSRSGTRAEALKAGECRPLVRVGCTARYLGLLLAVPAFALGLASWMFQAVPVRGWDVSWGMVLLVAALTVLVLAFTLGFTSRRRVLRWVGAQIKTRLQPLFDPSEECFVALVEDPSTFETLKLAPEDVALIRTSAEGIDLEMSTSRVHVAREDVRLALHAQEGIAPTGLNLSAEMDGWTWAVALQCISLAPDRSRDDLDRSGIAVNMVRRIERDLGAEVTGQISGWRSGSHV